MNQNPKSNDEPKPLNPQIENPRFLNTYQMICVVVEAEERYRRWNASTSLVEEFDQLRGEHGFRKSLVEELGGRVQLKDQVLVKELGNFVILAKC